MDRQGGLPLSCFSKSFAFWLCMMTKPMLWGPDSDGIVPIYWLAKTGIWGPGPRAPRPGGIETAELDILHGAANVPSASQCLSLPTVSVGFLCPPSKHNSGFQVKKDFGGPNHMVSGLTPSRASNFIFLQNTFLIGVPAL